MRSFLEELGQLIGSHPIKEKSVFTSAIVSHLHVLSERRVRMGHLMLLPLPASTGQFCEGRMLVIMTMLIYDHNSHVNTRRTESPTAGL